MARTHLFCMCTGTGTADRYYCIINNYLLILFCYYLLCEAEEEEEHAVRCRRWY